MTFLVKYHKPHIIIYDFSFIVDKGNTLLMGVVAITTILISAILMKQMVLYQLLLKILFMPLFNQMTK